MDSPEPDVLDLRDYLLVLRRRWVTVAVTTVLVVATAMAVTVTQTPIYEGTTELAVEPVRQGSDASLEDLILGDSVVATEQRVITSRPVTERVIEQLELDDTRPSDLVEKVDTTLVTDTRVITIRATDPDPQLAADLANGYAQAYLAHRRDTALSELTAARVSLDEQVQELQAEIAEIDEQLESGEPADDATETDDAALQARRDTLVQQLGQVESQLNTLSVGSNQSIRGGGEILVPAEVGETPVSPRPLRTGVLAVVLGLMLGVGLAFLRDHFDDAIRDDEDVRRVANTRSLLGRVGHWEDERAHDGLMTMVDPHDQVSEDYRALSANVRFALISHGTHEERARQRSGQFFRQQSIALTSANPGEGKSVTAGNLAVAAARTGLRVVLVEADLRRPDLARRFALPAGQGLSDLLVDHELLSDGLLDHPERLASYLVDVGLENLRVLPAGTVPPNPTELLAAPPMQVLHRALTGIADLVVYDSPPLLPVADTLELATLVDASVVIVRPGLCRRRDLQHAVERLEAVDAPIGGFVVNDISRKGGRYGYRYGYGYRSDGGQQGYRPRLEEGGQAPAGQRSESSEATSEGPIRPARSARSWAARK